MSTFSAQRKPRYVKAFTDRHGRVRYYYRRPGWRSVTLRGELGSETFRASYEAAERDPARTRQRLGRSGFVYAVQVVGFDLVKIGFSTVPSRRLIELEAGSGMNGGLRMLVRDPGTLALERALHARFASQRLFGEWFRLSGPVADWIDSHSAQPPP